MKVFLVAMVALIAMVATTGAQTPTQAQLEAATRMMDQNGNGFIEKEEMPGLPKGQAGDLAWSAAVGLGDSNNDGKLSISEFTGYTMKAKELGAGGMGGAGAGGQGGAQLNPDSNSNGFVEKDEMAKMVETMLGAGKFTTSCWEAVLKKADKDGDGKIGMQEFATGGMDIDLSKICSGASSFTTALSVLTLLALALRLF